MKHPILIIVLLASHFQLLIAQVPPPVQERFNLEYPEIEDIFWEQRENQHVAIFTDSEGLKKAFFEADGTWAETRLRVDLDELPPAIKTHLNEHYEDAQVTFCGKVYDEDGVWYRVESEFLNRVTLKTLDQNGYLISAESIPFSLNTLIKSEVLNETIEITPLSSKTTVPTSHN